MNTFNVGDKVKFLNEVGSGVVVEIIDSNMVMVESIDGFNIPFLARELIPQGGFSIEDEKKTERKIGDKPSTEPENNIIKEISTIPENIMDLSHEIYFGIVKSTGEGSDISNAYLVNLSSYNVLFHLAIDSINGLKSWEHDDLMTEEKIFLGQLPDFSSEGILHIVYQLIFYKNEHFKPIEPLKGGLILNQNIIELDDSFRENEYFDEKAFLLPIISQQSGKKAVFNEKIKTKQSDIKTENKEKKQNLQEEIDLHANEIIDDVNNYSPSEILDMQLARFEFSLETAIRNNQKKVVFIHGAGGGKLKHKIRKMLDEKYSRLKYQDASFKEYGYGATLVYLQ